MKRVLLLVVCMFVASVNIAFASEQADKILKDLVSNIEKLGAYKVEIEVNIGSDYLSGFYEVSNDIYYLNIENQELYGAPGVEYEIYNDRKEVIIDNASQDVNGNILSNPAAAFVSMSKDFDASVLSDSEGVTTVYLKPIGDAKDSIDSAELDINNKTMLPTSLRYQIEGEEVEIKFVTISQTESVSTYQPSKYSQYEIIDFR